MTDVIPYFRDYPNPQPAFTDDVHDMIRERMARQSEQAGTQPRGWDGPRSPGPRKYHGRRAIDRARVLELHNLGMTVQEIADDMDRSIRGVSRALGEVRVRGKDSATGSQQNAKKARMHREYLRPQVEDMLSKGLLKKHIAARLGVSMDTIRRIIAEGVDGSSGPA